MSLLIFNCRDIIDIFRPPRLNGHDDILDSVPPWIRDDPRYREFDTCKCRYSFNCPSPGLKFVSAKVYSKIHKSWKTWQNLTMMILGPLRKREEVLLFQQ